MYGSLKVCFKDVTPQHDSNQNIRNGLYLISEGKSFFLSKVKILRVVMDKIRLWEPTSLDR